MWITESLTHSGCTLETLDGARRLARHWASFTNDFGKFLIFEEGKDFPIASEQQIPLSEDD
jgi:hypothetical protein